MYGATYLTLLALLRQDETPNEARRRRWSTTTVQRRDGRSLGAGLLRALRGR